MNFKGSRTENNLLTAFAGESQARNKYTYYASKARSDGYEQIGNIFEETADNEKEHAKIFFKILHNGMPSTSDNLIDAASGEKYEWTKMYKEFANTAREEGFLEIATLFDNIAGIEMHHENRFLKLLDNINNNKVFHKDEETIWICLNCGYVYYGKDALPICPVCSHPESFMEIKAKNY